MKREIYDEVRDVVKERLSQVCSTLYSMDWIECWK